MSGEMDDILAQAQLRVAVAQHQAGRLAEAEAGYRRVLASQPDLVLALHNLGVITLEDGRVGESEALLRRATSLAPTYASAFGNLGLALNLQGRKEEALAVFSDAARLAPKDIVAQVNLGNQLKDLGRLEEAATCYREALSAAPTDIELMMALADTEKDSGHAPRALEWYQQVLALEPGHLAAHVNLGVVLLELERVDEAILHFQAALASGQDLPQLHLNLGVCLWKLRRLEEAAASFARAIALAPGLAEAYQGLAWVDYELGRSEEAIRACRRVLELDPGRAEAFGVLATLLDEAGDVDGAREAARKAAERAPGKFTSTLLQMRQKACDWKETDGVRDDVALDPFVMLSACARARDLLFHARAWTNEVKRHVNPLVPSERGPDKAKIRLGYLSADYRAHPVGRLVSELVERHDRSRFEVVGYAYGRPEEGSVRQRLETAFDSFVDLDRDSDEAAAERIRRDGVDILIDLTGYTRGARSAICAFRPAPIQVNYLGFPGTMGADFLDYIIADPYLAPFSQQPFYAEKIVHLPDCYQPSDSRRRMEVTSRSACGLPEDGLVLCSFNYPTKITPAVFDVWMRLLKAAPGAVLWLSAANAPMVASLRREAEARGVAADRLVFADRVPYERYLGRLAVADLFLDCFPFNAGATANDALWAGLPLLTCSGETYVSRMAGSLLTALGLPELIATSLAEYEAKALELVSDPGRLAALRGRLTSAQQDSSLFDIARYTRHLEEAYLQMWRNWQAEDTPHPFAVGAARGRIFVCPKPSGDERGGEGEVRETIHFITATRLSLAEFEHAPLGRSLKRFAFDGTHLVHVAENNRQGLPQVYNAFLRPELRDDILVFLHDDLWLDDIFFIDRVREALRQFDVVGLAGNTRLQPEAPGWHLQEDGVQFDLKHLSGIVCHGQQPFGKPTVYGPTPAPVQLMDGLMIAARCSTLLDAGLRFDERFDFHFYDLDFAREANVAHLGVGTWPIAVTHASGGAYGSPSWRKGLEIYREKWRSRAVTAPGVP